MKKTIFAVIFLALMMIGAFALSSCNFGNGTESRPVEDQEGVATRLAAPVVVLEGDTAFWMANSNAEKFEFSINGMLTYAENVLNSKKLEDGQKFKVRAVGDGKNYLTSEWSNEVEYQKILPTYTITWKCSDTILEVDEGVEEGNLPSYDGKEPTKDSDEQYHYVFAGWSPTVENAYNDTTYTAIFTEEPRGYTVTWMNGEEKLETDIGVYYGDLPKYNGEEPHKEGYTFVGWAPDISEVTCDVTYEAIFEEIVVVVTYTVVFCDYDGTVLAVYENLEKGETLTAPELPRRNGYTFIGWDNSFDNITSDLTVTAQYEAIENQICIDYTDNGDGTLTAKFSVNGDVNIAMIEFAFSFNLTNATITDYTVLATGSDANYVDDIFYFSLMSITDIIESIDLFSITFSNAIGDGYIEIVVVESYVSDGTFENITEANVVGTTYIY